MANEEGIIPCYHGHRKWEFFHGNRFFCYLIIEIALISATAVAHLPLYTAVIVRRK